MRYGLLSDIHGNLEALLEVLREFQNRSVDQLLCLGDVVGYGADPNACADLVRERCRSTVLGNHDAAAAGLIEPEDFNRFAREAVLWTAGVLTPQNRSFLRSLPHTMEFKDFVVVHASLSQAAEWHYILDREGAEECFQVLKTTVCFHGHSHVPAVFVQHEQGDIYLHREPLLKLEPAHRYLVNAGSVGQPRDGDPRACAVIYDDAAGTVEFLRIGYDIKAAQDKILKAGLPPYLAERLGQGR